MRLNEIIGGEGNQLESCWRVAVAAGYWIFDFRSIYSHSIAVSDANLIHSNACLDC